jgi:TPR repeat protein
MTPYLTSSRHIRAGFLLSLACMASLAQAQQPQRKTPAARAPAAGGAKPSVIVRLVCEDESAGAEVTLNGVFKGECPLDMNIEPGTFKLRATKQEGAERERVYETELVLAADTIKRITLTLSEPRLTRAGQQAEAARADAMQRQAAAELLKREQAEAARVQAQQQLVANAEAGQPDAMVRLADMYENGRQVARDVNKAFALYQRAAATGHPAGMGGLGAMYLNGWGTPRNAPVAEGWLRKAAMAGDGRGMNGLANLYEAGAGGLSLDRTLALDWKLRAAEAGNLRAIANMGERYVDGDGVTRDRVKGLALLRRAAEAGSADAMTTLATCYRMGKGVVEDIPQALVLYRKAAELGDGSAMNELGAAYASADMGLPKDERMAASWFRKGAEAGDGRAMANFGTYQADGLGGVPRDQAQGVAWMRKAAALGDRMGIYQLRERGL